MQHDSFDGTEAFDSRDELNVVILYDQAEAGRRAMSQLRSVTDQLEGDVDLQIRLWRLDVAADTMVGSRAASDISTADLLVISLDDVRVLDEPTRERLEDAVHQIRGRGAAVTILTNRPEQLTVSQFDFLRNRAGEVDRGFLFPSASKVPTGNNSSFATTRHHDADAGSYAASKSRRPDRES